MIERREAICRHANWNGIRNEMAGEEGEDGKVFNFISFFYGVEVCRERKSEMTERMELN